MKKIDRLREVERLFGPQYVLPYVVCETWRDIERAIRDFERRGVTWGLRTDTPNGSTQAYHAPFLFHGTRDDARTIFDANGKNLLYIPSENIPSVLYQAVALPVDDEHVVIEFNDREPNISQREMGNHPEHLRQIGVGPARYVLFHETFVRSFHPYEVMDYRFDEIHALMIDRYPRIDEVTFTARRGDRRLIIW